MFGVLFVVLFVAAVIKLVVAACGHRITWRLAILLAFVLTAVAVSTA
jgi:hypothetical protein